MKIITKLQDKIVNKLVGDYCSDKVVEKSKSNDFINLDDIKQVEYKESEDLMFITENELLQGMEDVAIYLPVISEQAIKDITKNKHGNSVQVKSLKRTNEIAIEVNKRIKEYQDNLKEYFDIQQV